MQKTDRWLGLALALLAGAVLWSARDFPAVPGQKVGAGFLPTLVGIGLLLCGLGLVLRSLRAGAYTGEKAGPAAGTEHFGS
ncbi:MAG: tripartite tricarboxylate transporter TctB family protein, partial [Rubrivivax sp.]|nr:tripartite tricarboxylate transporter TctB family protein [Rubrivivax sp.]